MDTETQTEIHRLRDDIGSLHRAIDKVESSLGQHEIGCVKAHADSESRFNTLESSIKIIIWMVGILIFAELFGIDTAVQAALRAWGLPW